MKEWIENSWNWLLALVLAVLGSVVIGYGAETIVTGQEYSVTFNYLYVSRNSGASFMALSDTYTAQGTRPFAQIL